MKNTLASISIALSMGSFLAAQSIDPVYIDNLYKYGNESTLGSARYRGMSGSMGALGGELSAAAINPAALGVIHKSTVDLGLNIHSNKSDISNNGVTNSNSDNGFSIANGGIALKLNLAKESNFESIVFGLISNTTATVKEDNLIPGKTDGTFGRYQHQEKGFTKKKTFALGANYNNAFYIGAGLNFHNQDKEIFEKYSATDEGIKKVRYFKTSGYPYHERGHGFSANIGVIAKAGKVIRLGASYQSPTWWSMETEGTFYDNGTYTTVTENDMYIPGKLTASIAAVIGTKGAINFDYSYQNWENAKLKPSGEFETENTYIKDNMKEAQNFKIGGETRIDQWRLRAGYRFEESPFKEGIIQLATTTFDADDNYNPTVYSDATYQPYGDLNGFSLGIGYDKKSWYVDLSYEQYKRTRNYIISAIHYNKDGTGVESQAMAKGKEKQSNVTATVGFRF